jgi:hypothetical protein
MFSVIFPTITSKKNDNQAKHNTGGGGGGRYSPPPPPSPTDKVNDKEITFPTVLNFNTDDTKKTNIDGKKILFILDGTGSMSQLINYEDKISKSVAAKKLIEQVIFKRSNNEYDVMVFNERPYPVCKVDAIPEPNSSTYFSPLVDEIIKVVTPSANYCAVIFMSDGLPTEPLDIAQEAIRKIGNTTREMGCNPVAVAIGNDADGGSCALFAGNRGYNCFIDKMKKMEEVATDINHGIDCKYKMLDSGIYIPIEADGKYYFVGSDVMGTTIAPNKFLIEKYLNLVILQHVNDPTMFESINTLVATCSKLIDDITEQKEIVQRFTEILHVVHQNYVQNGSTPGIMSSGGACYRAASQQV